MTDPTSRKNLDGYDSPIIDWERVRQRLDDGITQAPDTGGPNRHTAWLATTNPNGRPHVVALGMVWDGGKAYFTSGPGARKAKNLALSPYCTLSVATQPFDITVEGPATIVTDQATLERVAGLYAAEGWAPTVRDGAFHHDYSAQTAGPPPWYLYELTPERILALGTAEPFGATRFDF